MCNYPSHSQLFKQARLTEKLVREINLLVAGCLYLKPANGD